MLLLPDCNGQIAPPVAQPVTPSAPAAAPIAAALAHVGQALIELAAAMDGGSGPRPLSLSSPHTRARGPAASDLTLLEAVNEFLLAKARAGRSDRYLRQLRVSLKSFALGRGRAPLAGLERIDVQRWLDAQVWSPVTAKGYSGDVRTLFNFAVRRGYLERNPALAVETPATLSLARIAVHQPDQAAAVLATARRADLDACRHLAVRYFSGIRTSEAHLLREPDLRISQGLIEVPAVKSKTRRRRLVTIQPNLAAWLALGGELRPIGPMTIRRIIRLARVSWPPNVTRHSFVSYHLAAFENAGKTALEAGHSEQMLFTHYRALVTPEAAAAYWAILPA